MSILGRLFGKRARAPGGIMNNEDYWERVKAIPKADPRRFEPPPNPCEVCLGSGWGGNLWVCTTCKGTGDADATEEEKAETWAKAHGQWKGEQ